MALPTRRVQQQAAHQPEPIKPNQPPEAEADPKGAKTSGHPDPLKVLKDYALAEALTASLTGFMTHFEHGTDEFRQAVETVLTEMEGG